MTIPPRLMHNTTFKSDNISVVPRPRPPTSSWWITTTNNREEFIQQWKAQAPRWRGAAVEGREP